MVEKTNQENIDKQKSSLKLDNFFEIKPDNLYIQNIKEKVQAEEKSPLKEIVQELLEKKEITAKDLLSFSDIINQAISKIDFKQPIEQVTKDIFNLFKGIEDQLGILKAIILREKSSDIDSNYLLKVTRYYEKKNKGKENLDFYFEQAKNKLTNVRLILNSYLYQSNPESDELFCKLFERGKIISNIFDDPIEGSRRRKTNNISLEDIVAINEYVMSWTKTTPIGPDRFIDFKKFIEEGGDIKEYIYFKNTLNGKIKIEDIEKFLSYGVGKEYIEKKKIDSKTLKDMIAFKGDPKLLKFKNMIDKEGSIFKINANHIAELYEEMEWNNGDEIKDGNGINIIDGLRNFVDTYGPTGVDIKLYDDKNAKHIAYNYPLTVNLNTQKPGSIQFFRGLLQYIKSTNQDIPTDDKEWKSAIGKYEKHLKEFIDAGNEEDKAVEVVYILIAAPEEDKTNSYQPTKDQIKSLQKSIYKNAEIIDISSDALGQGAKTKEEIIKLLENSVKAGKKTRFLLGLHGGIDGKAQFKQGDFLQGDFEEIKTLQRLHPGLLSIEYISCNSKYKNETTKRNFIYNTMMDSGKHVSTNMYSIEMIRGTTKHFASKQKLNNENKNIFTGAIFGGSDLKKYSKELNGNIYLDENIKNKSGKIHLTRINQKWKREVLTIEFKSLNDLKTKIEKEKKNKGAYYSNEDISYRYDKEKDVYISFPAEGKKPIDFNNLYDFLSGINLDSQEYFYPADINGDGNVSSNELRIYEMLHYNDSFLSTWYKDKNGKIIRIADNSNNNDAQNRV